jgi:hypothetical protein
VTREPFGNQIRSVQAEQLRNDIADASTSAVFSERRTGPCAKLPPTDAKVSANTILQ